MLVETTYFGSSVSDKSGVYWVRDSKDVRGRYILTLGQHAKTLTLILRAFVLFVFSGEGHLCW